MNMFALNRQTHMLLHVYRVKAAQFYGDNELPTYKADSNCIVTPAMLTPASISQ